MRLVLFVTAVTVRVCPLAEVIVAPTWSWVVKLVPVPVTVLVPEVVRVPVPADIRPYPVWLAKERVGVLAETTGPLRVPERGVCIGLVPSETSK